MSTGTKIAILAVIVLAAGGVGYYFLRKKNLAAGGNGTVTADDMLGAMPGAAPAAPVPQGDLVAAAGDFYQQSVKKMFEDAPVPIPGDLTAPELSGLQNFCKLNNSFIRKPVLGSALSLGPVNYDVKSKEGLSNSLYDRSGYTGSRAAYLGGLKTYFKC